MSEPAIISTLVGLGIIALWMSAMGIQLYRRVRRTEKKLKNLRAAPMNEPVKPALTEIWRPVVGYEMNYEVSSLGRVARIGGVDSIGRPRFRRILRQSLSRGYFIVSLCRNATSTTARVHRLVASAFLDGEQPDRVVNHIDGVKTNNAASNLEWITQQENEAHAVRTGLKAKGERHGGAKLTDDTVAEIRRQFRRKEVRTGRPRLGTRSATNKEIGARYGVSESQIERILSGRRWAPPPPESSSV